jgi:hypothetical protein
MESIHNKTGKKFTGRFAEIAVKIGIAKTGEEKKEAPKKAKKKTKK